jgi:hypothetical protein
VQVKNETLFERFDEDFYRKHHHGELNRSQFVLFDESRCPPTEASMQIAKTFHGSSTSKMLRTEDSVSPKNRLKSFEFDRSLYEKQTTT